MTNKISGLAFWGLLAILVTAEAVSVTAQTPRKKNGKIAFTSDRDGNHEIYVMNPDGTNQTRLTNNNIIDDHPKWSPDGQEIAFLSQRHTGEFGIFVMNADGTGKNEITNASAAGGGGALSWSPDGQAIVFQDGPWDASSIVIVNADGSNRRDLTAGSFPAWSPDGSKILFRSTSGHLATIRPDGGDLRLLPIWSHGAVWHPDGSLIAFSADISNGQNLYGSKIFRANPDGLNPEEILGDCITTTQRPQGLGVDTTYCVGLDPDWSPDGRRFVWVGRGSEMFVGEARIPNGPGGFSPDWQPLSTAPFDYDGDGKTDFSVYRPSNYTWYVARSLTSDMYVQGFGGETVMPADYDGDGKTDIAVSYSDPYDGWQGLTILSSSTNTVSSRTPSVAGTWLPADFDGDGRADLAGWYNGSWEIELSQSEGSVYTQQWGLPGDKPVPADFDGDGKAELVVWRPSEGKWYVLNPVTGSITVIEWGLPGDIPVVGDYSGDGKADFAVYRPSNNTWYRLHSSDYSIHINSWGLSGDYVTPGDYDGDGKQDLAVWRPSNATWYVMNSTGFIHAQPFGLQYDIPTPSAFVY